MGQYVDYGYGQQVWNSLLPFFGGNEYGTAAMMGNLFHESGIIPYRLQGDFSSGFQTSLQYTSNVDNGIVSEHDFVNNGPNGGGYGLAQWTYYTRKQALYNKYKTGYASIGDINLALDYLQDELNGGYASSKAACVNATNIAEPTIFVLKYYENPADSGSAVQQDRIETAQQIYDRYAGGTRTGDYLVTIVNEGDGITTAYPKTATAGTTITLIDTPNAGASFVRHEVLQGAITIGSDNTFVMPTSNVVIKALYTGTTPPVEEYHYLIIEVEGNYKGIITHKNNVGLIVGVYPFVNNGGKKTYYYTGRRDDTFQITFIGAKPVVMKTVPASAMVDNTVTIPSSDVYVIINKNHKMPIWMYRRRKKVIW